MTNLLSVAFSHCWVDGLIVDDDLGRSEHDHDILVGIHSNRLTYVSDLTIVLCEQTRFIKLSISRFISSSRV